MNFGFKRKNHLKSKLIIDQLFAEGKVIKQSPFRLVYLELEGQPSAGVQVLISVPKRRFKLAVHRNRIRRIISEQFRLQMQPLQQKLIDEKRYLAVGIIYLGNRIPLSEISHKKMALVLDLLLEELKAK